MADTRTLEQVTKENEALEKELNALRSALGIDRKEAEEERARVHAIFTKYDVDKSGSIDRAEFDLLAFEAGVGAEALDEKGVGEIFATIKPKNPTAVTFDEFNAWFVKSKNLPRAERKGSVALAAKLQSKALVKTIEASKAALKAAKAKVPERKTVVDRKEVKAAVAEAREGVRVRLQVGEFKDVGLGVVVQVKTDAASTAVLRRDLDVPTGKSAFAFVDLGVAESADEGKLGELAGVLEGLLAALGGGLNEKAGIPLYHGHTVKLVGSGASRVLRIAGYAEINPTELVAAQLGRDASLFNPGGLFDLRVALETPLSLNLLKDDAARLTVAQVLARFTIDGGISSVLDRRVKDAITGLLPEAKAEAIAAGIRLFRGINLDVQAITLDELSSKFSTPFDGERLRNAHEGLRFYGDMLPTLPLKALFEAQLGGLAAMGSELPEEVKGIYALVRSTLTGPKKIHAQVDDLQVEATFTGFDIFQFAPALSS